MVTRRVAWVSIASLLTAAVWCRAAERSALPVAPDESLSVAQYIEAGSPAGDREWSSTDYERFAGMLRTVAAKNTRSLPRFDSTRSGALMKRVVSEENFAIIHDPKLPLSTRVGGAVALNQSFQSVVLAYSDALSKGESFDRELVEFMAYTTKLNLQLWAVADELLATLTPEQREARKGALEQMRSGTAQIIAGAITSLTETDVYRASELVRLATLLEPTLPLMIQRVSTESATEATVRLRSLAAQTQHQQRAASLLKLLKAVEAHSRPAT